VLEPLVQGLKARGFCFATLREHPVPDVAPPGGDQGAREGRLMDR
jgi:hypothetical protein